MRTIHLNLATRPYRNYRPVYLVVAVISFLTLLLLVMNFSTAYRYFVNTRQTRDKIAAMERAISLEVGRGKSIEAQLGRVNVRSLALQTRYINAHLAERAFSWSQLLDELERVLPRDVRLVSLNPSLEKDGTSRLTMTLQSKTSRGVIETLNRFQTNSRFYRPFPSSQTTGDSFTSFGITVDYLPPPRGLTE